MSEPAQKPGRSRQDFGTPRALIVAVERRFGPIVCDLAASAENAKAPLFIDRARDTFTVPWAEEYPTGNLWFNPEFAVVLGLNPRVTFEGCTAPYPKPLMISVYGLSLSGFDTWRWK